MFEFELYKEKLNRLQIKNNPDKFKYLYPDINDEDFNIKIAERREFYETKI